MQSKNEKKAGHAAAAVGDEPSEATPWARQRFMWAGQAARCQGRRSVVGAAEARGRVKPRSSAASRCRRRAQGRGGAGT